MRQIIKSVFVCLSVCVSVCGHSHNSRISWSIFTKIGADVRTRKRRNEFVRGSISHYPFPYFQNPILGQEAMKTYANIKQSYICLKCTRIADIAESCSKSESRNTIVTSDLRAEVEIWPFRACVMHPAIIVGTVRSLWTWLWGTYHVPQNVFLVIINIYKSYTKYRKKEKEENDREREWTCTVHTTDNTQCPWSHQQWTRQANIPVRL